MTDFEKFIRLANNIANFNENDYFKGSYYFNNSLIKSAIRLYDETYIEYRALQSGFEHQCSISIFENKSFTIPEKGQDVIDERIVEICYFDVPKDVNKIIDFIKRSNIDKGLVNELLRGIE